ncbi:ABC transporter ATP-binding protein [Chrysiogenes arsenatis]|uniref:ABC transporter ATP-binding protein n=1 Tax=Chrysiogenes arsenatis TaxID=309797 RepID=UPI0004046962|nr:ABC transporter ATP-binding protein [Chrysiogenes arsenatis]
MTSEVIIRADHLCHAYEQETVLHDISFTVTAGKIFGLLGKNGAGKTTAINIIMGFLQPQHGQCTLFGEPAHALLPATKQRIALLHEGHLSYEFFDIQQTESFYRHFYPKWESETYHTLVAKLGLSLRHKIGHMSCGQRSQIALAVLMAQNADLLILDDFSMGLDAGYRRLFLEYLNRYVTERKKTVLITSHIMQDLERFIDEALVIDKGRVVKHAPLTELHDGWYGYYIQGKIALAEIECDPTVQDISHTASGYQVICTLDAREATKRLNRYAQGEITIQPYEISLEDTFLALTGKY